MLIQDVWGVGYVTLGNQAWQRVASLSLVHSVRLKLARSFLFSHHNRTTLNPFHHHFKQSRRSCDGGACRLRYYAVRPPGHLYDRYGTSGVHGVIALDRGRAGHAFRSSEH